MLVFPSILIIILLYHMGLNCYSVKNDRFVCGRVKHGCSVLDEMPWFAEEGEKCFEIVSFTIIGLCVQSFV